MPFAKIILPEVNRKFAIRFSTPTEDICTLEAFHKFFSSEAAYNIIPGFENTSIVDVETYLLQVMPFTTYFFNQAQELHSRHHAALHRSNKKKECH